MSKDLQHSLAKAQKQHVKNQKRAKKIAKANAKAEKKAQKKAILSIHKRPIVCPPDQVGRHPLFRIFGYICRALVVWLASAGLVVYLNAAFQIGVPMGTIFKIAFVVVALAAISLFDLWGIPVAAVGAIGSAVAVVVSRPSIFTDIYYGILAVYNAALDRLVAIDYTAYEKYKVYLDTATPRDELRATGIGLICVVVAVVFAYSLVRRVRIIPPAILATTCLVLTLTFNVYTNLRNHDGSVGAVLASNLGIVLVIVSFATVLVMAAYDRLYRVKDDKHYDTEMKLFGDSDRPAYPAEYEAAKAKKEADKANAKAARKASRKASKLAKTKTVDEELSDYFGKTKTKKVKPVKDKKPLSPAEKKQKKAERYLYRKQLRAAKRYDRVTEQSRAAMGGFASIAAMLLACIIILLPAITVTGRFEPIEAIDEKMSFARDYVTALLRGNDEKLDELEYKRNSDNFRPRSTDMDQLEFTGKQIFYVESRYNTNYYLRGWIGTGYEDGAWTAVSDDTLDIYRSRFSTDRSPGEEFRYNFYHYMMPSLVDDPNYNDYYLSKYQSNLYYGFVNALVSLRRINSPSSHTYFPSTFKSTEGMFDYGSTELSEESYVNYFDGIYTGRAFEDNDTAQATVTYAQVMTNPEWAKNQAKLIASYNLQREILLIKERVKVNDDGSYSGNLTLLVEDPVKDTVMFSYQYKQGREEIIWRTYHKSSDVSINGKTITVSTPAGTMEITREGNKVRTAELLDAGSIPMEETLIYKYVNNMTSDEQKEVMSYLHDATAYAKFVYNEDNPFGDAEYEDNGYENYDTYVGTSDSEIIKELAGIIKEQAHTEELRETLIEEPDDPETEEFDPISYTKREWIDIPADVSLAAVRDSGSPDVYIQRDILVRNVIDYIIYDLGCEYTITPDTSNVDPALDGVENFLKNTKEGYCVQFASSAALILRELGIPVRYVEGYIASELSKKGSTSDMSYGGYVRDYEAHAWIEVYYDGVGWIQYETTPQYYGGMYGVKTGDSIVPNNPVIPPEIETQPPVEQDTLPEEDSIETDTETDTGEDALPNDDTAAVMKASLIALGVLAGMAVVAGIIGSIVSAARRAEDRRQSVVSQVLESHYGNNVSEDDRREMAFSMSDSIHVLLKLYDLMPKPGEFRDEYADRLTAALNRPEERGKDKMQEADVKLPDLHKVLDAMSAEEFGHGMTVQEMKLLASFYLYLRRDLKRRLSLFSRIYYRFIKHMI